MLAMGDALAMSLSSQRGFRAEDFAELHPVGSLGPPVPEGPRPDARRATAFPACPPRAPMTEAIHEMSRKMMGITAVVDGDGRLRGVISDGDLRRLLEQDPAELARTAGECCRPNPRTISAEEFASGALEAMRTHQITSLFVVDGEGALAGALHMHDLLTAGIR